MVRDPLRSHKRDDIKQYLIYLLLNYATETLSLATFVEKNKHYYSIKGIALLFYSSLFICDFME